MKLEFKKDFCESLTQCFMNAVERYAKNTWTHPYTDSIFEDEAVCVARCRNADACRLKRKTKESFAGQPHSAPGLQDATAVQEQTSASCFRCLRLAHPSAVALTARSFPNLQDRLMVGCVDASVFVGRRFCTIECRAPLRLHGRIFIAARTSC